MTELSGADVFAKVLKEEGVDFWVGIHGGNVFELLKSTDKLDIKMIHMRTEPSAVFFCDGWSKAARKPAVCFAFGHPGTLNMVSAIAHCYQTRSPVILIGGGYASSGDAFTHHRLGNDAEVFKPVTKWSKYVSDWSTISYHLQRAFRDAVTYPPGPIFLEIPSDIQAEVADIKGQLGYLPDEKSAPADTGMADPATIEKAVRLLLEAEKPILIGGNGVYWAEATDEFRELAELLQIPVGTRELNRGTLPDDHPLVIRGRYAGTMLFHADVVAIFGLLMGSLEANGQPPLYRHDNKKYILVSQSPEDLDVRMPTEVRIQANPKKVLRQMLDCARDIMKKPPDRKQWLDTLASQKKLYLQKQRDQSEQVKDAVPINPHFLAQEVADFLDDSATIIIDSFMFGGFMPNRFKAKLPGHVLDAGMMIGVGHSVGMAMGARMARPGTQVLGLIGDGGLGITGFDLEAAVRYKIPAAWLLYNNAGWMSTEMQKPEYTGRLQLPIKDSYGMIPGIRYDKMFAEIGCHTEYVTEPEQIRPALERSFNSGKPALINVIPDNTVLPPFLYEGRLRYGPPPPQPKK